MAKKNTHKPSQNSSSFFGKYKWEGLIFFFAFFLYANSIPNGYNMDDELVTIHHRLTSKGISAIPEIFTSTYYKDDMGYAYEYRPVVLTSFAIEYELFGDNPFVSHVINVLLYGLCCILLFGVLLHITRGTSVLIPLGITLLFIAHPAHTEIVCSIKNRDEILALIFGLLTCLVAFKVVNNYKWVWLLPVLFALALMSKLSILPFAIIIPMAVILFTKADFTKVMSIAFLLALSSFIVLIDHFKQKSFITALLLVAVVVIFIVFRFKDIRPLLKWPAHWKVRNIFRAETNAENPGPVNFNSFISSIKIESSYFDIRSIWVVLTGGVFLLSGIFTVYAPLSITGVAILLAVLILGNDKNVWWAKIFIYFGIALTLTRYHGVDFYAILFIISIVYQVLYGQRKLFLPLLFIFIFSLFFLPFGATRGTIIALISAQWIWTRPIAFLVLITTVYDSYKHLSAPGLIRDAGFIYMIAWRLLSILIIISLLLKKWTKTILLVFQIVGVVAFFYSYMVYHTLGNGQNNFKDRIADAASQLNTNIITEKQDRPLNFVEQPLMGSDSWQLRAGTSAEVLGLYLHKIIFPYPMAFYYGYKFILPVSITQPGPIISVCLYGLLLLLALYCVDRNKLISFGIFIYLISIVAVAGYLFPIPGQLGERFMFIPSLGWCIVFVIALGMIFKGKPAEKSFSYRQLPKGYKYGYIALLCLYSTLTFSRNFDWKDSVTLMKHDIDYVQNSSQANNLLALNMMKKSYELPDQASQTAYRTEALGHFKKAREIYPDFYNATYDVARVYSILGPPDSTIAYFKLALALDSSNSNPALFIGQTLLGLGRFADAIPYLQFVIRRRPADYDAYDKLSFVYFRLGDAQNSIEINKRAIIALPGQPTPYVNIARVYISLNEMDSARACLQKAMALNPNDQGARNMLMQMGGH